MSLQLAQPELSRWESIINSLRVNELQSILQFFKVNKLGKKQDLIIRVNQLLRTPQHQPELVKLITAMNRPRPAPYNAANSMTNRGYPSSYNNMHGGQPLYGNGGVTMSMYNANNAPKPLRGLRPLALPFYDLIATILEPVELVQVPSGLKTLQKMQLSFSIPLQYHRELTYRESTKSLPRYELQLRFFNLPQSYHLHEQPDDFPPNCSVRIDDVMVVLPNVIPTNKPNVEAKRPSRPVNITQNCQPPRDTANGRMAHRMFVEWTADRRSWAVAIYLVNRVTSDILRDRAVSNVTNKQEAQVTRQQVIRRMTVGDDDGIKMDQVRISLLCPLGKTRMGIPARCRDCSHLQCFDLDLFLKMNEKRPTWKCGICSGNAPYGKLIIDGYFQNILREVTDVNEIELLTDGGYQKIQETTCDLSDSDDDVPRTSNNSGDAQKVATVPKTVPKPVADEDIITLDSDEDEELQRVIAATSTVSTGTPSINDTPPRTTKPTEVQEPVNTQINVKPDSVESSTSAVSISPPMAIPHAVPSTSATVTSSAQWRDNPGQNGTRVAPSYTNYAQFQNTTQAYNIPQVPLPPGYPHMWNVQMPPQQGNNFNPNVFIGGNMQAYRNGTPFTTFYHHPADQQNRAQHYMQPQTVQGQTLADKGNNSNVQALQAIANQPTPTYQQQNFQRQ